MGFMGNSGIRFGSVYGIEIRLDYTWFILLILIFTSFSAGILPVLLPGLSALGTVSIGLLLSFLFFLSILIHELAHSIYAKKTGIKIERLRLFIFGGAAEIEEEPKKPGQEFIMAGLGPFTSIVIGITFAAVAFLGLQFNNEAILMIGSIMGSINIVLAAFNLLPGFPLDGGRMFRAIMWKITNDFLKATRIASMAGQVITFALMALGFIQLIGGNLLNGIWLIIIGFFLNRAAAVSYQQTLARFLLDDVPVKDLMRKNHQTDKFAANGEQTVAPQDSVSKALNIIGKTGIAKLPVVDGSRLVGVISIERIRTYLSGKPGLGSR